MAYTDLKYLLRRYNQQIIEWRKPPVAQSWESICRRIADAEKLNYDQQPHSSSLRRAWLQFNEVDYSGVSNHGFH